MRSIMVLIAATILVQANAQEKYYTKTGHIEFYSHAPLEDITAVNDQVAAVLDIETGILTFALLVKSFEFEKALMQQHFNENYMESDEYPKATFKGEITNMKDINLNKAGEKQVMVTGDLTIHGVTRNISITGTINPEGDELSANAELIVKPEEYKIRIPKLVRDNIAREIRVKIHVILNK